VRREFLKKRDVWSNGDGTASRFFKDVCIRGERESKEIMVV